MRIHLGVTGERAQFHSAVDEFLAAVKGATSLPVAIGFGISNHEQYARFASICDGVVVGSAIVRKVEEVVPLIQAGRREEALGQIRNFVKELQGIKSYS